MDAQFLDELQEIIGCQKFSLPLVFIGGRYIGGAEEIRQLHENGELKKLIARLPVVDPNACDLCVQRENGVQELHGLQCERPDQVSFLFFRAPAHPKK